MIMVRRTESRLPVRSVWLQAEMKANRSGRSHSLRLEFWMLMYKVIAPQTNVFCFFFLPHVKQGYVEG